MSGKFNGSIILLSLVFLFAENVSGQNDPQAIKILDRFSANALEAPSVSMKFKIITVDQAENSTDTTKGRIMLSKDKYCLELPENIVWFNGESSWSYLPAEKEVTIAKADKKDNSFQNRPSSIFSMYKKGYKCRLVEERTETYIIDLYPEDIKSDLTRVRLNIGKNKLNLTSLEYKKKDGVLITLHIEEYNLTVKPTSDSFVFQQAKYKGVEVIDMR